MTSTLICVSGLPQAETTLQMGDLVAGLQKAEVTLITMIQNEAERLEAEEMLADAEALLKVPVSDRVVRLGSTATGILTESTIGDHDMILVGASAMRSFWQLFLRSIPREVARRAETSVLVVRQAQLRRVLICAGGLRAGRDVIKTGAGLAATAGADVTLLHVVDPVPGMYTGLQEMDETLPELLQSNTPLAKQLQWGSRYLVKNNVQGGLKVRQGIVTDEIVQEATEGNYDLVVVGARSEANIWNSLLMGTVTPQVVDRAPCSVLVVRTR